MFANKLEINVVAAWNRNARKLMRGTRYFEISALINLYDLTSFWKKKKKMRLIYRAQSICLAQFNGAKRGLREKYADSDIKCMTDLSYNSF